MMESEATPHRLALVHGLFYVVTGFWPLISIRTFEAVSGPKTDDWLVKTAGGLIGVIGIVLTLAGLRRERSPEVPVLAIGSAATLALIDTVYVKRKVILPIYLIDAAIEASLALFWLASVLLGWKRQTSS